MKKTLKILFYTVLTAVIIILAAAITIFIKYNNVKDANLQAKYIKAVVNPQDGKVPLGEKVETTYILNIPWDKRPVKLKVAPGKGSQSVDNPVFKKEKLHWGYYTWKVKCGVQPFINGEIPEGKVDIIISPDKDGKMSQLKLKFPKIFSKEIPVTKNTLNVATTIQEQKTEIDSNKIYYIIAGAILLVIIVIVYFIFVRKKKDKILILSSWAEALLELNKLKEKLKEKAFNAEKSITVLTDIVRHYLEDRFKIQAQRQTTEEFLKDMEGWKSPLNNKDRNFLREFMVTADMIKFAKLDASEKQVDSAIERAEELVKETIPDEKDNSKKEGAEKES
jgi:hypothetical protein